jgi:predicted small secreted protein
MSRIKLLVFAAALIDSASQGCATMHGIGEDIQSLGRAIKRTFGG